MRNRRLLARQDLLFLNCSLPDFQIFQQYPCLLGFDEILWFIGIFLVFQYFVGFPFFLGFPEFFSFRSFFSGSMNLTCPPFYFGIPAGTDCVIWNHPSSRQLNHLKSATPGSPILLSILFGIFTKYFIRKL